ncbi:methyltransferase family protein [Roseibium aquae]|uniref:methyltransferase family protein n=1 Tax=Roseibium aquae TaxID=1323746 RepID=UPI0019D60E9A|nr:isoprenylcysteine carboxylmethyltransferase family protein [Roseibium aquae]
MRSLLSLLKAFPPLRRAMTADPVPRSAAQTRRDLALALVYGGLCHAMFGLAVLAMIAAMWFGMSRSLGAVPSPWGWFVNAALIAQFPLGHSFLLTRTGGKVLAGLAPAGTGKTLATTTYALVASIQLGLLFVFWTPSGIVWWQAEGALLWLFGLLYGACWLLLIKASFDAGAEVQSGLLGWASLARGVRPQFPPMPSAGLFAVMRHPIYLSFTLTLWTVPTWTPDQLLLASLLTLYCVCAPVLKERRYTRMFGAEFEAYRAHTPYFLPRLRSRTRQAPSTNGTIANDPA